jgi:hypothetical protein
MTTTQGKCNACRLGFRWTNGVRLRDAYCPNCHGPLAQTSHLLSWAFVTQPPAIKVGGKLVQS